MAKRLDPDVTDRRETWRRRSHDRRRAKARARSRRRFVRYLAGRYGAERLKTCPF